MILEDFMKLYLLKHLSFTSFRRGMFPKNTLGFQRDFFAALSGALLTIPQAIGCALIAGLPFQAGLVSCIMATLVCAFFSFHGRLQMGPTNAIGIMVSVAVAEVIGIYFPEAQGAEKAQLVGKYIAILCLIIGSLQVIAAVFKFGDFIKFVSLPVITGYISGVALAIIASQLFLFFGIVTPEGTPTLLYKYYYLIQNITLLHIPTTIIAIVSLISLVFFKVYFPKLPGTIVVIALAGFLSQPFQEYLSSYILTTPVKTVGDSMTGDGLIDFTVSFPRLSFEGLDQLLPIGFAIAILGMLETLSLVRSLEKPADRRDYIPDQDVFALGVVNIVMSFFAGMPASSSPTRSKLHSELKARSRFATITVAILVVGTVFFAQEGLKRVPLACLAALLCLTASRLINLKLLKLCYNTTNADRIVMLVTLLSCLVLTLDLAFYIGLIISILLYLKSASRLHFAELDLKKRTTSDEEQEGKKSEIRILNVRGDLFFGSSDMLQKELLSMIESFNSVKVLILRLDGASNLDATTCHAFEYINEMVRANNMVLLICGVEEHLWAELTRSNFFDVIGKNYIFKQVPEQPLLAVHQAFDRAKEILGR